MRSFLLKAALSVAMIAVIVTQINVMAVLQRFASLPLIVIAACICIAFAQIVLLTYRWSLVCRLTAVKEPFGELLRCMMVCQFFSQGLPASVGGDALRVWWLTRLAVPVQRAAKNVLTDRLAGLIALMTLNVFAVPLLVWTVGRSQIAAGVAAALVIGGVGVALIVSRRGRRLTVWAFLRLRRSAKVRRRRTAMLRWVVLLQTSASRLFRLREGTPVLLWGISIHFIPIVLCLILARQAGYNLTFLQLGAVLPAVLLLSYLPISIGSWGIREGGMLVALGFLGVPPDDAVFVGVALGSFGLVSALAGAVIWFMTPMPATAVESRP
jgi:glycosyltransferase 2 family protein